MDIPFTSYDLESETVGSIIQKPAVIDDVITILEPSDFYYPEIRTVYEACCELNEKNKLDAWALRGWLQQTGRDAEIGGADFLHSLMTSAVSPMLAKETAEQVKLLSLKRKGLRVAQTIVEETHSFEGNDAGAYISNVHNAVTEINLTQKGNMEAAEKILTSHMETKRRRERKKYPLLKLSDIDLWMNGIGDNRLIVVAGRPGTGKTAFTLQSCYAVSTQGYGPAAIFSMEMGKDELLDRLLSNISNVPFSKIYRNDMNDLELQKVDQASRELAQHPLYIDDTARMTMTYITAQCRKLKREHGRLGCVAIDYLGLVDKAQKRNESTVDAIGRITRECKLLAREIGCSVFLLVQMNREIDKRTTKRPIMSDLRDSGSIEQDADMVIFLYKDEEKSDARMSHIDFIVAKGRQTGVKDFELAFFGEIQKLGTKAVYAS